MTNFTDKIDMNKIKKDTDEVEKKKEQKCFWRKMSNG